MRGFGLLALGLTLLVVYGLWIRPEIKSATHSQDISVTSPTPMPRLVPDRLIISKLHINTPVELVGTTQTGAMDLPKDATKVGWWRYGPTPTQRGNAVIAGHFDTPSGRPAIFYSLNRLVVGDTVTIELSDHTQADFIVTGKELLPIETFPGDYVFGDKYGTNLNLITCAGVWDPVGKNYNKRLVVYTTQKGTAFETFQ